MPTSFKSLLFILLICIGKIAAQQNSDTSKAIKIILQGNYEGKNIYVQNPYITDSAFCIIKVEVNSKPVVFENASAIEINLKNLNLQLGDKTEIIIFHHPGCSPKVFQDHGSRKSTFELTDIQLCADGILKWSTINETGKLVYYVEQFRWNKWIKIGEVNGKGERDTNNYTYSVPLHTGLNNVRVKQVDHTNKPRISKSATTTASIQLKKPEIKDRLIEFSDSTLYELYDESGNIIKKGSGKTVDCHTLPYGKYFLNYDNTSMKVQFELKKKKKRKTS